MTKLALASGDDYPAASRRHLLDSMALLHAGRVDGAAYLSGYVVECALKSLWLLDQPSLPSKGPWGRKGHDVVHLASLVGTLCAGAGSNAARYFRGAALSLPSSSIASWDPNTRYQGESRSRSDAEDWWAVADSVFMATVAQMYLDGVL